MGPSGRMKLLLRTDLAEAVISEVLTDPDRFVPAPIKRSQAEKLLRRRAVYSFWSEAGWSESGRSESGRKRERLYLKLYRVRTLKDVLEEVLFGKRAVRSLRMGLEAERRGIACPVHLGASHRLLPGRWPARSALLMVGIPHNRDVRTVLKHELEGVSRRRFLTGLGRFVGQAHRLGLIHGDLKIRNLFVLESDPVRLALIDFDRARFVEPGTERGLLRQSLDLRSLGRSLAGRTTASERRRLLGAYLQARRLSRAGRGRLLRWLALQGGF